MACGLWFGTEEYMQWIETPLSGADSSPQNRSASGTDVNGGGWNFSSFGSHRLYNYSWRNSSARTAAQVMKNYASGTWGRGLLYFVSPLAYDTNILPARWADPSITVDFEGPSLVYGVTPKSVRASEFKTNMLPVNSTSYDLGLVPAGHRQGESVFIPIPEGYDLLLGGVYSGTGTGGVYYVGVDPNGNNGPVTPVPVVSASGQSVTSGPRLSSGQFSGIRLFFGKTANSAATLLVQALTARLVKSTVTSDPHASVGRGPWVGGQGHSGCKFDGMPTYVEYNGVQGGQVGYSTTLREVGDWA